MTKKELVAYVAEKTNLSKKDAEVAVNAVFDGITEALKTGSKVQLVGFGSCEGACRENGEKSSHRRSN